MKKIITSDNAPSPIGPYSQAVQAGGMVYLSGQIAIDQSSGKLISGDIVAETNKVMENISHVLAEAELTFSDVIKCTIFLKNMDDFSAVNDVYGSYFTSDFPARECVQVSKLPKDVNVEITAIALAK